jgi:MinD-like ATPase involved in chromosome partitioning or flagellar assembly
VSENDWGQFHNQFSRPSQPPPFGEPSHPQPGELAASPDAGSPASGARHADMSAQTDPNLGGVIAQAPPSPPDDGLADNEPPATPAISAPVKQHGERRFTAPGFDANDTMVNGAHHSAEGATPPDAAGSGQREPGVSGSRDPGAAEHQGPYPDQPAAPNPPGRLPHYQLSPNSAVRHHEPPPSPEPEAGPPSAPPAHAQDGYGQPANAEPHGRHVSYPDRPAALARRGQRMGQPHAGKDSSALLARLSADVQTPPPAPKPARGWRRLVLKATGGLVNPGLSKAEETLRSSVETITGTLVGDCYRVAVLVAKGGTGKSTVATCVASVFAEMRSDDRVIAVDADPSLGKIANRIAPSTAATYWELLADDNTGLLHKWNDVKHRLGSNSNTGLWMVRGDWRTDRPRRLIDAIAYRRMMDIVDRYMSVALIDCGQFLEHPVMPEVLGTADAVIIVAALEQGGTEAAGQTLQWLETAGYQRLLGKAVVVLNDPRGRSTKRARQNMVREFTTHTDAKTVVMPFDPHLSAGGVIDTRAGLSAKARTASIEIATHIARGFADTVLESGRA